MSQYMRVLWAMFYKFLGAGLVFVTAVMTANYIGPQGRGFLSSVTNNLAVYSPVVGSYSEYIPYGINKRRQPPSDVFTTALFYCFLFVLALFVAALAVTPLFWDDLMNLVPSEQMTWWIAGLAGPFALFHVFVTRLILGLNELEWLNRLNTLQSLLAIPLFFLALTLPDEQNEKVVWSFFAWLASYIVTASISAIVAVKKGKVSLVPKPVKGLSKEIFRYGNQLAGSRLLTQLNYRIDYFFVLYLIGVESAGIYSVAVTVADMLLFVSMSLLQVVVTRVSSLEEKDSSLLTARTFRHTAVILFFSLILFYLVMPYVIRYAFGEKFEPSLAPYYILLPGVALLGLAQVLTNFFTNQLGQPKVLIRLEAVSILSNVILSLLFFGVFHMGAAGMALAKTSGFAIIFLIAIIYFCRATGYPFWKMFVLQQDEIQQYKNLIGKVAGKLRRK
ncbi:O-antigen/teichoic acid export membrane protein [Tumebacillus sp. BK434]|uniref:oligosaccharide flippase family protein n=1 Tax=Tumebacillus sp. BK434 TaxID=2512169 RepID=UPI001052D3B6|nr:oligosaccharide flippase family protein [Tumebacillus sp. BK434]TCP55634.1 O-antigen/teichoic acid export membrane protein [Tumebacillus sp. BK434]